MGNGKVVS